MTIDPIIALFGRRDARLLRAQGRIPTEERLPLAGARLLDDSWIPRWTRRVALKLRAGVELSPDERIAAMELLERTLRPTAVKRAALLPPAPTNTKRRRGAPKRTPLCGYSSHSELDARLFDYVMRVHEIRKYSLNRTGAFEFVANDLYRGSGLTTSQVENAYRRERQRRKLSRRTNPPNSTSRDR